MNLFDIIESEDFDYQTVVRKPKKESYTTVDKVVGVRKYIEQNCSHILNFNKKETQCNTMYMRVNFIINLYDNRDISLKQKTINISENFNEFKLWLKNQHFNLNNYL